MKKFQQQLQQMAWRYFRDQVRNPIRTAFKVVVDWTVIWVLWNPMIRTILNTLRRSINWAIDEGTLSDEAYYAVIAETKAIAESGIVGRLLMSSRWTRWLALAALVIVIASMVVSVLALTVTTIRVYNTRKMRLRRR